MIHALSIKQPWAWLIVNGFKDIENRSWPTRTRGEILVHAGKVAEPEDVWEWCERHAGIVIPRDLPLGALVGKVKITDCVTQSTSKWFFGPHGFTLEGGVPFEQSIPYKGQLGFFPVPVGVWGDKPLHHPLATVHHEAQSAQ